MNNPLTQQPIDNESLKNISDLATRQLNLEANIKQAETNLEEMKERCRNLSENLLPEAMMAIGMEKFSLSDGTAIKIDKFYSASIPKENATASFAWLRANNFAEIIKRKIECTFGKGDDEKATLVKQAMIGCGVEPIDKESVHPQTLKAFVREQLEEGHNLPTELFGVYVGNRTKITPATKP
jgi:hypothetical protein